MTEVPPPTPDGAPESVTPGWYPTADGQWLRYHDGLQWTEHATPAGHAEKTAVPF